MTIYDVYGTQHHASICVQADGEKVWTFDPLWEDFWHDATRQKVMEQALDNDPHAAVIYAEGVSMRTREASPC
jgi:hypothetical protein